jgi:hypothetical protein
MFERHHEPLLPVPQFFGRIARSLIVAAMIDGDALVVVAVGLRWLEGLDWMDAWLNAALVMTGNGPTTHGSIGRRQGLYADLCARRSFDFRRGNFSGDGTDSSPDAPCLPRGGA